MSRPLSETALRKADIYLQIVLREAAESTPVIVSLVLQASANELPELYPADYENRVEWRKALIKRKSEHNDNEFGSVIKKLDELSLTPQGGLIRSVIMVEGTASQIMAALELPEVISAHLNHEIEKAGRKQTEHNNVDTFSL